MTDTFSADEVVNLATHQSSSDFHSFTCPNRGDGNHRDVFGDLGALVPTVRGWICPFCAYTQDWAHEQIKSGKTTSHLFSITVGMAEQAVRLLSVAKFEKQGDETISKVIQIAFNHQIRHVAKTVGQFHD